jgi:hypothetical protein
MSQLQSGETYADGQTVNAARLNNTVNLATALPGLITDQGSVTPVPADQVLLHQASSGTLKRATIGTLVTPASFQGGAVVVAGTNNTTTGVMMGLPGTITPSYSGRIFVIASGSWKNNTTNGGGHVALLYGTGTKPANGAALTGSSNSSHALGYGFTANAFVPFSVCSIITGLTIGTSYWLDIVLAAVDVGTVTLVDNSCMISAFEF